MSTKKPAIRLLANPKKNKSLLREKDGKGTIVRYKDELVYERRRPLTNRPAGTECGDSCTCS